MDGIKIQVDIIKTKLLVFMGLTAGGWGYLISHSMRVDVLSIIVIISIMIGSIAVANNLTKLAKLYNEIEELKNGK